MLRTLGLPDRAQAVYVDLLSHGAAPARQVASRLGIPRSSLYDQVRPLLDLGLVVEREEGGKAVFAVSDIEDLDRLVAERMESLTFLRKRFATEKSALTTATPTSTPRIKFIEGKEGISALLKEILWDAHETIETVWPYNEMLAVFEEDELDLFNRKRIKQNIALRSIWTGAVPTGKNHIWRGGDYLVERRVAPKKYAAKMGYSISGDKVSFVSSAGEQYAFVVHSAEFAALMRTQFAALWQESK
jgi:HTH-type transcriptional regulator, sugar sensing transcriptional regulator